jgi:SAM-dependent methyltransferase
MNWKTKAFVQSCIAAFPSRLSYQMYFHVQRHFGGLKKPYSPLGHFSGAVGMLKKLQRHGKDFVGKTFFEVGTGRVPLYPVAFWLCGAAKTITVDLNPYMRNELIEDMLSCIEDREQETRDIFGTLLNEQRFNLLLSKGKKGKIRKHEILELCQIEYLAPADAAKTNLPENTADFHVSNTVYEHIPLPVLQNILEEGNRIICRDGLFVNTIDYKDHFRQMDKSISAVNFLQYSDSEWNRYAGNRYMYMNRARHDDFIGLFKNAGHDILETEPYTDASVKKLLQNNGLVLDSRFRSKNLETLSIVGATFITRKRPQLG